MKLRMAGAAVASLIWLAQGQAAAWDPFVVENDHVAAGNERMGERDAQGALTTRLEETHGTPEHAARAIRRISSSGSCPASSRRASDSPSTYSMVRK